ncbi:MAG: 50S ribosomal protein L2 [Candidatus Anstonellales archaeon]
MGKLLKQQRRGKGSFAYKAPSHRYKADIKYRDYDNIERESSISGEVIEFIDDPGHQAVLMRVRLENSEELNFIAPEGICIGDTITLGAKGQLSLGSVKPLSSIPDGFYIYNVELSPGDGGKITRAPGSYSTIVSREGNYVLVKLPSRKLLNLPAQCRAQIGVVCGGGRLEKPLLKAGANFYKKHAQNRLWPKVRGVKQNAYTHPFGGKQHHPGKPTLTPRGAPPGRKVGHLGAKSVGRKKAKEKDEAQ